MTLYGSRTAKATISSRNSFMALLAIALFKKLKEKVKGGKNKFLKKYTTTAKPEVRQPKKVKSKSGKIKKQYGQIQKTKAVAKIEEDSKSDDRKRLDTFIETQITRLGGRDEIKGMSNTDIVNNIADNVINQIPDRPNILNDLFPSIFTRLGEEQQIDPRTEEEIREAKVEAIVSSGDESPPMTDPLKNVRGVLPERTKAEIAQEKKKQRQIKKEAKEQRRADRFDANMELDRLYGSGSEDEDNIFEQIRINLNNIIGLSNDQKDEIEELHTNLDINLEKLLEMKESKAEAVSLNRNFEESRANVLALIGNLPDLPETKNTDINRILENLPTNMAVFKPLIRNLLKGQIGTASEIAGAIVGLMVSSLITKNPVILGITMYITRYISGQFNTEIENTINSLIDNVMPSLPEPPTPPPQEEKQPVKKITTKPKGPIGLDMPEEKEGDPDPDPDPEGGGGDGDPEPEEKKKKDDFRRVIPLVAIATTLLLRKSDARDRILAEVAKNVGGAMLTGRILGRRISYGILRKIGYTTDDLGTMEGRRLINLLASVPSGVGGYIVANYIAPFPSSENKNAKALYQRGREVVSNLMKDIGMTLSDVNLNITTPYKLGESPFDKPKKDKQLRGREFEKIPSMGLPSMGIPSMKADTRQRSTPIYKLYDTASKRNIPSLTGRPEEQLRQEINQNITILKENKTEKGLNTFRNILTPIFNKYSNVVAPSILKEEAKRINAETERIFTEEPTTTTTTPAPTEQGFISSLVNSAIDTVSNMIGTGGGEEDDYIYERKIEQSKTDKTKQEVIDNTLAKSDQVEQKDRKGKANMKWQPKVIVPSTDIFSESNHEKYIDAVEFAQFNYVPKGSEGGYGTPATNPLKMADKLSEEIRYKGAGVYIPINYYNELLEASRLNEKKLKELFLPPELPPMKFINQNNDTTFDNVNTRFYVNNENTAVGITDPYSKFSNVDNYWMTNPNNVLFTINP